MAREKAAGEMMGLWSFFFGKTVKIGDEFFGEMVFAGTTRDASVSYFECQRYFKPSGELIGLSVDGSLSGPTQRQKDFFTQIESEYPQLVAKLRPLIEEQFGAWMPQPVIKNFEAEFKPTYLSIPSCNEQPIAWEIAFDTIHDVNHIVTVGMLGDEPQYVRVDG